MKLLATVCFFALISFAVRPSFCATNTNLYDTLKQDSRFTTFIATVERVQLVGLLTGATKSTIFAPTNAAFDSEPIKDSEFQEILGHHMVAAEIASASLHNEQILSGTQGVPIRINFYRTGSLMTANGAPVIQRDMAASNGVIHVVSKFIKIPTKSVAEILTGAKNLSIISKSLELTGLMEKFGQVDKPMTLFAPTDAAMNSIGVDLMAFLLAPRNLHILPKILLHHIVEGSDYAASFLDGDSINTTSANAKVAVKVDGAGNIELDNAKITQGDVLAVDGVVQIIDHILVPPLNLFETAIFKNLTTFASASMEVLYNETLSDPKVQYTVLLPANSAFVSLGTDDLANMFKNDQTILNGLKYHVIEKMMDLDKLKGETKVKTNNGESVNVNVVASNGDSIVTVNGKRIIEPNVVTSNGIIHVMDSVLVPPAGTIWEIVTVNKSLSIMSHIMSLTGLETKLNDKNGTFTFFAPTDAAFKKIGITDFSKFYALGNGAKLKKILDQHTLNSAFYAIQLVNGSLPSASGESIAIKTAPGSIKINNANITGTDRTALNGVVHFVDNLLVVPHVDLNLEGSAHVNFVAVNILALLIALLMIL